MAEVLVPIFRVENARDVVSWYGRLGFEVVGEHQFEPGFRGQRKHGLAQS